jgi:hypothetical protein
MSLHQGAALALDTADEVKGVWLAIPRDMAACAENIVLAGDARAPNLWRTISAERGVTTGHVAGGGLTALSDFGIAISLYPHTRVISVRVIAAPAWRGQRMWDGAQIERLRIASTLWPLVAAAARDCNLSTYQRSAR